MRSMQSASRFRENCDELIAALVRHDEGRSEPEKALEAPPASDEPAVAVEPCENHGASRVAGACLDDLSSVGVHGSVY